MKFNRRDTLILAASASIASTFGLGSAQAQEGTTKDVNALANVAIPDIVEGAADAKVTVIEYASPTCPHCAAFAVNVYPAFKTEYVDTGKVKFIMRPFIRNLQDAVVFLLAYSAGEEKFHQVVDTFFQSLERAVLDSCVERPLFAQVQALGLERLARSVGKLEVDGVGSRSVARKNQRDDLKRRVFDAKVAPIVAVVQDEAAIVRVTRDPRGERASHPRMSHERTIMEKTPLPVEHDRAFARSSFRGW